MTFWEYGHSAVNGALSSAVSDIPVGIDLQWWYLIFAFFAFTAVLHEYLGRYVTLEVVG